MGWSRCSQDDHGNDGSTLLCFVRKDFVYVDMVLTLGTAGSVA